MPLDYSTYTCTMQENAGNAELLNAAGERVNAIYASRCFLEWYCPGMGYTWRWMNGDPDAPPEPEEPPAEPTP